MQTLPRLYVLTDEEVLPNEVLLDKIRMILDAGVRMVQVRFKQTQWMQQVQLGKKLRALTRRFGAVLIANDSPQLAREIEADGVHLGAGDAGVMDVTGVTGIDQARRILGPDAIIGVSCYDSEECVRHWKRDEVSYIGLASPYPSSTKTKAVPDISKVKRLVSLSEVPVYLIGGIHCANTPEVMATGCHGIAVISAIFKADNPAEQVLRFLTLLDPDSLHISEA